MRRLVTAIALCGLLATSACETRTEYGDCVGISDEALKNPALNYKVNSWNVFWGIVGFEMVFPPVLVVFDYWECPVGPKSAK